MADRAAGGEKTTSAASEKSIIESRSVARGQRGERVTGKVERKGHRARARAGQSDPEKQYTRGHGITTSVFKIFLSQWKLPVLRSRIDERVCLIERERMRQRMYERKGAKD